MKTRKRWLDCVLKEAATNTTPMPWQRITRPTVAFPEATLPFAA